MISYWGLLGPETLPSLRRTRTLGLSSAVRRYNDLAVPGIGGVWFAKQLLLPAIGLTVAEEARKAGANVTNIEVANAIEALACWLSFRERKWKGDSRLRGRIKLQGNDDDFSYSRVSQRGFYLTTPMRMAAVQALPSLGLADAKGDRFNSFRCSAMGTAFINRACENFQPFNRPVITHLVLWVLGKVVKPDSSKLYEALAPDLVLPNAARKVLHECLLRQGQESREDLIRRCNALSWLNEVSRHPDSPHSSWEVTALNRRFAKLAAAA